MIARAAIPTLSGAVLVLVCACQAKPQLDAGAAIPATASNSAPAPPGSAPSAANGNESAAAQTASTTESAPTPAASSGVYRVAAIGDSITDARTHGGKYLDVLRASCPKSRFDNYGIGGQMVNQMQRRFADDVLSKRFEPGGAPYTHVIVFGGVNDLYSNLSAGRSNDKIERDLGAMYDAAHAAGIRVVALTVAPWGGFRRYYTPDRGESTRALNTWIRNQRKTGRVDAVIDAYKLLSCGDAERLCDAWTAPFNDGLHFGREGHERLGLALLHDVFADCE